MADTLALGASAARHGGSSPLPRTNKITFLGDFLLAGEKLWESFCEDLKTFDSFLKCLHE
jgi:hypothetical protein